MSAIVRPWRVRVVWRARARRGGGGRGRWEFPVPPPERRGRLGPFLYRSAQREGSCPPFLLQGVFMTEGSPLLDVKLERSWRDLRMVGSRIHKGAQYFVGDKVRTFCEKSPLFTVEIRRRNSPFFVRDSVDDVSQRYKRLPWDSGSHSAPPLSLSLSLSLSPARIANMCAVLSAFYTAKSVLVANRVGNLFSF